MQKFTTALTIAGFPFAALAQQQTLEPSVITGSRSAQSISDTPYTTHLLSEKDLQQGQVRTIPDAFAEIPGVLIQKTAHGHGSPFIRGFTGRQNLLLVDGIRANNSTWRGGPIQYWNTFDTENLASLEVIKGQGSVLYGSDAIGGTVNLLSKSSNFENETGFFTHGRTHYRYNTNSQSHIGRLEAQLGQGGKWGLSLGASFKKFGDIRDSAIGLMKGTGYPEQAYDLKFETLLDEYSNTKLTFAHQYLNQDNVSRWHRTLNNPGWNHGNHITDPGAFGAVDYDQERSLTYARLQGETKLPWLNTYQATLSYQKSQDSVYEFRNAGDIRNQVIDLQTYGIDLQFTADLNDKTTLTYGADYYRDEINAAGTRERTTGITDNRPVPDDSSYDNLGIFAQLNYRPTQKWEITPGIRYAYAKAKLGDLGPGTTPNSASESWDQLVAELRAVHHLTDQVSIYGGVSQAFRAPNINDLAGNITSLSGTTSIGSLDVEPELAYNFELGTRFQNDKLSLQFAGYYTIIKDQIGGKTLPSGTSVTTNAEDGYIFGFEADLTYQINDDWTWRIFASAQDTNVETADEPDGQPLSRTAPLMGGTDLRWTHPNKKLWIKGSLRAAATADRFTTADQASDSQRIPTNGTPSYAILSLNAGYDLTENLNLTLGIENILDDDYRYHGSGQNQPGTAATIGLTATF